MAQEVEWFNPRLLLSCWARHLNCSRWLASILHGSCHQCWCVWVNERDNITKHFGQKRFINTVHLPQSLIFPPLIGIVHFLNSGLSVIYSFTGITCFSAGYNVYKYIPRVTCLSASPGHHLQPHLQC